MFYGSTMSTMGGGGGGGESKKPSATLGNTGVSKVSCLVRMGISFLLVLLFLLCFCSWMDGLTGILFR